MSGNFSGVSWNIIFNEQNVCTVIWFNIFIIIDLLMLSRIELETFYELGTRDNRYTTAPELS